MNSILEYTYTIYIFVFVSMSVSTFTIQKDEKMPVENEQKIWTYNSQNKVYKLPGNTWKDTELSFVHQRSESKKQFEINIYSCTGIAQIFKLTVQIVGENVKQMKLILLLFGILNNPMSVNCWVDKQIVVHLFNETLLSDKKGQTTHNKDEFKKLCPGR